MTDEERFWEKVKKTRTCWLWTGSLGTTGYGRLTVNGMTTYVHRLAHEWFVGPIPEGFQVDHLCDVRNCVNPAHLEAVSHGENLRRIAARGRHWQQKKTHCPQGHAYTPENTYIKPSEGRRRCKACLAAAARKRRAA